jgi:sensor c-di-GMP phosphodiesterase-like protein
MGTILRGFTRRNVIAIAIGVLLAGAPLIAFDVWLSGLIDQQGQADVDTSARRAISLAEAHVDRVVDVLDELAAAGVASCTPGNIAAMRQAAFQTFPIKEIELVGPDGKALCTDLRLPLGQRNMVSSEPLPGSGSMSIDVLQLPGRKHAVRLRRKLAGSADSIGALVPAILFLPQVSARADPSSAYARVETRGGALIGQLGVHPAAEASANFVSRQNSRRYGFQTEVSLPRGGFIAKHAGIERLGMFVTAGVILALVCFSVLIPRRDPNNPVDELKRAMAAGEFVPYYQPIVDIRSGQLRGAEVLARWKKPDGSLMLPGAFIPLAESSGLIRAMTRDLMRRVCAEAGAEIGRRPALKISFNFAGQLFSDDSIVKEVRAIFSNSPIKLSQVVLEVTERDPIENFTATRQTIAALQGLGLRIAIDDVGTGHSGLSYMLKLGVDIIKIDKMFVDAIGTDRNSTTIIETLIDLAHNMRMDVVAEGVENFEQVIHLRDLGIRSAQGYVFAPPLPGSAFLQLIEAIDPMTAADERDAAAPTPLAPERPRSKAA